MYNKQQLEAINSLDGRIRVIAGAGTGKTATLTERYIKLLDKVKPSNILCVTFTNKAANEMKERIEKKVGKLDNSFICTFHGFCLRILRQSISRLGYPNNFIILDKEDQKSLLKKVYKECDIDYEIISYSAGADFVSHRKIHTEQGLLDLLKKDNTISDMYKKSKELCLLYKNSEWRKRKLLIEDALYWGYLYYEQKNTALDFNDLIILTVTLFKQHSDILQKWQSLIKYIMVDEFQDASDNQSQLVNMLSEKHGNLFVVGDPDQTIYSWRGAVPEILVDFDKQAPTKTIILNQNYRSTPNILNVANHLIARNTLRVEKDLFTEREPYIKVHYNHLNDNETEAEYIVRTIKQAKSKFNYGDIAVLYRMHMQSRIIEEKLIRENIPYIIYSGVNFYERKEIKDILAYLRLVNNTNDDIAFERIINSPKRGIGKKKIDLLKSYAQENYCSLWTALVEYSNTNTNFQDFMFLINLLKANLRNSTSLVEFTQQVLDLSGYQKLINSEFEPDRKENVQELLKAIAEYDDGKSLDEYLQHISLLTNIDKKNKKDVVSLMTIHSSKGLEFPVVFVPGLSENFFPARKAEDERQLEEERRLAYVAYTRAKDALFLTDSDGYTYNGEEKYTSRFVTELQKDSLNILNEPNRSFIEDL